MQKNKHIFKDFDQMSAYFTTQKRCIDHLIYSRWGSKDKIRCVHCDHDKVYTLKSVANHYKCAKCKKQFSILKGSIFENTKIPLRKWFMAIYFLTSQKKGISSLQLARNINVMQKTAWFMLHRIRKSYGLPVEETQNDLVGGENAIVEVDETIIGGKVKNMSNKKRRMIAEGKLGKNDNKVTAIGFLQRSGKMRLQVMKRNVTLATYVSKTVSKQSKLMTDAATGYRIIGRQYFMHGVVDHGKSEYARGECHTNTLEGAFSLLDRLILGTYHSISPKHTQAYLNEHAFRYNYRQDKPIMIFNRMLSYLNTRLTYAQLIKK